MDKNQQEQDEEQHKIPQESNGSSKKKTSAQKSAKFSKRQAPYQVKTKDEKQMHIPHIQGKTKTQSIPQEEQGEVIDINASNDQNIQLQIQEMDFGDPKNRQALEDQFFGAGGESVQGGDELLQLKEKQKQIPKKFYYLAISLALTGIVLVIVGFVIAFSGSETMVMKGGAFWVIGALCCIPGIYYSYKIFRSHMSATESERMEAQSDIPRF